MKKDRISPPETGSDHGTNVWNTGVTVTRLSSEPFVHGLSEHLSFEQARSNLQRAGDQGDGMESSRCEKEIPWEIGDVKGEQLTRGEVHLFLELFDKEQKEQERQVCEN